MFQNENFITVVGHSKHFLVHKENLFVCQKLDFTLYLYLNLQIKLKILQNKSKFSWSQKMFAMPYNYNKILISKHLGAKKNSKFFLLWTKYVMSGEVGASPPRRLALAASPPRPRHLALAASPPRRLAILKHTT